MPSQVLVLGAGCFWCVEACYRKIKGVQSAVSGYSGGDETKISYKEVYTGTTGHAEVVRVEYNPDVISTEKLLYVYFAIHDPTQLNRQNDEDVGSHYRSVIFYQDLEQKELAEKIIKELDESGSFSNKVVTELTKFEKFFPAEDYHQNYLELNPDNSYCQRIVRPKYEKFKKLFQDIFIQV
jgi:peptide-methionine (S)-S-oxide reductase